MGRCVVLEHLGSALYKIALKRDIERLEKRVKQLRERRNLILGDLLPDARERRQKQLDKLRAQDDSVAQWSALTDRQRILIELQRAELAFQLTKIDVEVDTLNAELISVEAEIVRLEAVISDPPATSAWCGDYTLVLQPGVDYGTMELPEAQRRIPGPETLPPSEQGQTPIMVYPGWDGQAIHNDDRDGKIQPVAASGPPAYYFNHALLPAWQKWRPTYRIGTITRLEGDICDVSLDEVVVYAHRDASNKLDLNQTPALTNVPIEYMQCNGAAFEMSDRVVVRFKNQNWTQPTVIGFETNPRPCGGTVFVLPVDDDYPDGFVFVGEQYPEGYGQPPPQSYVFSVGDQFGLTEPARYQYGNVNWQGDEGVLSWYGPWSRYWWESDAPHDPDNEDSRSHEWPGIVFEDERFRKYTLGDDLDLESNEIFYEGNLLVAMPQFADDGETLRDSYVAGAAIAVSESGARHLLVACRRNNPGVGWRVGIMAALFDQVLEGGEVEWTQILVTDARIPSGTDDQYIWCFSANGLNAVSRDRVSNGAENETWRYDVALMIEEETLTDDEGNEFIETTYSGVWNKYKVSTFKFDSSLTRSLGGLQNIEWNRFRLGSGGTPPHIIDEYEATDFLPNVTVTIDADFKAVDVLAIDYDGNDVIELCFEYAFKQDVSTTATSSKMTHNYTYFLFSYKHEEISGFSESYIENATIQRRLFTRRNGVEETVIIDEDAAAFLQSNINKSGGSFTTPDALMSEVTGIPQSGERDEPVTTNLSKTVTNDLMEWKINFADIRFAAGKGLYLITRNSAWKSVFDDTISNNHNGVGGVGVNVTTLANFDAYDLPENAGGNNNGEQVYRQFYVGSKPVDTYIIDEQRNDTDYVSTPPEPITTFSETVSETTNTLFPQKANTESTSDPSIDSKLASWTNTITWDIDANIYLNSWRPMYTTGLPVEESQNINNNRSVGWDERIIDSCDPAIEMAFAVDLLAGQAVISQLIRFENYDLDSNGEIDSYTRNIVIDTEGNVVAGFVDNFYNRDEDEGHKGPFFSAVGLS